MRNYFTIKLRYFLEWILKHTIQDMTFKTEKHTWFLNDTTLVITLYDRIGGEWVWAFGELKPNMQTEKIGKSIHINGLGGGSWSKIFGNWFACIYRGKA